MTHPRCGKQSGKAGIAYARIKSRRALTMVRREVVRRGEMPAWGVVAPSACIRACAATVLAAP
jgi:hypothetical protein